MSGKHTTNYPSHFSWFYICYHQTLVFVPSLGCTNVATTIGLHSYVWFCMPKCITWLHLQLLPSFGCVHTFGSGTIAWWLYICYHQTLVFVPSLGCTTVATTIGWLSFVWFCMPKCDLRLQCVATLCLRCENLGHAKQVAYVQHIRFQFHTSSFVLHCAKTFLRGMFMKAAFQVCYTWDAVFIMR